jgi:hypothetical protein
MGILKEWSEFVERIHDEIELLNQEVEAVRPLADKLQLMDPDPVELRAAAATLHAFYSGIERVLLLLVRRLDSTLPSGVRWHRQLIDQASVFTENRMAIISHDLREKLVEYLGFRHVFRHNYPGTLRWEQCSTLFRSLPDVLGRFRTEVESFLERFGGQD